MARPDPNICSQKWVKGVVRVWASIWTTSCATAGRERTRARRTRGERRSPNMTASVEKWMVTDGEIVVLSCKKVLNLMVLHVVGRQERSGFCRFGRKKY